MKVYLFISKQKKLPKMYLPYIDALNRKLDITHSLVDADIVLILGAWTMKGARLASKSRKMGIPYIVCPLGDISERNRKNPHIKRSLQTAMYQKTMYQKAELVIATTPMEQEYLTKLNWNQSISLIRYFGYSQLTSESAMMEDWNDSETSTLADFERRKAEAIADQTQEAIVAQIMQILSRMPHKNIPQKYMDDLHTLLYADDYDEDVINEELTKLKLSDYAASVFQAMTERTGLTEGFMPLPAKKGRKSKEILKYVKSASTETLFHN